MINVATFATNIDTMVRRFPQELQAPMRDLTVWMVEEFQVSHKDFSELKDTVQRVATLQEMTEHRLTDLTDEVERLAEGQEKLVAAQQRTEQELQRMGKTLSDQISALGSRWGIYNEGMFRSTMSGVLSALDGVTVKEGYYGGRQVDIVIRNGEHILLEITSRMHAKDIDKLYQSADDYEAREGVRPKLMVATSYVSPKLMQTIIGLPRPIEIFSYEAD